MKFLRCLGVAMAAFTLLATEAAVAQTGSGVLNVVRGAATRDVSVAVNRAVVLEAAEPFAEVSVANPGIADVAALSNRTIYILGKQPGRTTLTLLGNGGRLIANVTIRVGPDLAEFKSRLREILPGEPVEVRTANDGIVLSGTVSGVAKLARAVELAERYAPGRVSNMMTVGGTQQVMLKVRFAEVNRNASKELGFNWAFEFLSGRLSGAGESGDFLAGTNGLGQPYTVGGDTAGVVRLGWDAGSFAAEVVIDALEGKGAARTLAEPNLIALSGDTASFLAGGEYPIPVASDDDTVTVEFRPFGVSMGFTPTVVDDDLINLQLEVENSGIDSSVVVQTAGFAFNGFRVRRASTTVEMRDGQSFAIAGLLQDDFVDNVSQIPWIGDVPILGTLFRSADFQRSQTELVIIITAHLVAPTSEDALSSPTDRFRMPSEQELFLMGATEGDPVTRDVATQDFEGSFGYVME